MTVDGNISVGGGAGAVSPSTQRKSPGSTNSWAERERCPNHPGP